jgi:hypothetical protein
VKVGQETEISLDVGGTSVCNSARASGRTDKLTNTLVIRIKKDSREMRLV